MKTTERLDKNDTGVDSSLFMPFNKTPSIIVVGATGLFGELLCRRLVQTTPHINLTLCARSQKPLSNLAASLEKLKNESVQIKTQSLDISALSDSSLKSQERDFDILVNASGPFQYAEQNYNLMRWCAKHSVHYIDLADDADFVMNIPKDISELALKNNVSITSGVSSVPALSSSVFRHYKKDFTTIEEIDIGITPGNKTRRGLSTVRSILSYTGQTIQQKRKKRWVDLKGWGNLRKYHYTALGQKRYLSNCLSPDNALFHKHYPQIATVRFQAGLELPFLHLSLSLLGKLASKCGFNLEPLANNLLKLSNAFLIFGSDKGAMHVVIYGHDHNRLTMSRKVEIVALDGSGPYIPTLASLMLIDKITKHQVPPGTQTGFELFDLSEFESHVQKSPTLPISFHKSRHPLA